MQIKDNKTGFWHHKRKQREVLHECYNAMVTFPTFCVWINPMEDIFRKIIVLENHCT